MWFLEIGPCSFNDVNIPLEISNIVKIIYNLIKIGVPIILIILGMLDMGKAVTSQKEDEIKKGQKTLISRCIAAAIVFFVFAIVQLILGIIGVKQGDGSNILETMSCLFNGK